MHNNDNNCNTTYEKIYADTVDCKTESDINKDRQEGKHTNIEHVYFNASNLVNASAGPGEAKRPTWEREESINGQSENAYSYAYADVSIGLKAEEMRESLNRKPSSNSTLKSKSKLSNSTTLSRTMRGSKSRPGLSTSSVFNEEDGDVFTAIDQVQKDFEPQQSEFLNSITQDFVTSISSPGSKKKTNIAYQGQDSILITDESNSGYSNGSIGASRRWKIFLVVVIIMIVITAVMIAIQVMNLVKPRNSHKDLASSDEELMRLLSKRTMRLELQSVARRKEISSLQRITTQQKMQIKALGDRIASFKLKQNTTLAYASAIRK